MNLDESVRDLLVKIKQTYKLILENATSLKINALEDILAQIAQVMRECAQFIAEYSETKNFCMLPILR